MPKVSMVRTPAICAVLLWACTSSFAQAPQSTPRLEFEAASIRPAGPRPSSREQLAALPPTLYGPETFYLRWQILKGLVMMAFRDLDQHQIVVPDALNRTEWDVSAKAPPGATEAQIKVMWQNLLADRFHLVYHRESRVMPVWELTIAKGGTKMVESSSGKHDDPRGSPLPEQKQGGPLWISGEKTKFLKYYTRTEDGVTLMAGRAATLDQLRFDLQKSLLLPGDFRYVLDNTGLTGSYDFGIEYIEPKFEGKRPGQEDFPDIFTAVQRYLGLQLKEAKRPVEVLVVDKADAPTEN